MGYKLLASIMLERLKKAGAESRLWETQCGFKSKAGTADALFVARRLLDQVWASSDLSAIFLALDWAKAFDSISPASLSSALLRFGIPQEFVTLVDNIYSNRRFFVQDCQQKSDLHQQHFGISQGCPLSPFLFVILMTVLLTDAEARLKTDFGDILSNDIPLHTLVYADDTLLIDCVGSSLEKFMNIIADLGAEYGLELNWKKVEFLPIRCDTSIRGPELEWRFIFITEH